MAWTKQTTKTANVSNDDIKIVFDVPEAGAVQATVIIKTDATGPDAHASAVLRVIGAGHNAGLTAQERADLVAILIKIRDAALPVAGFSQV